MGKCGKGNNCESMLYGVHLCDEVTPIMARDAIIRCFSEAHAKELDDLESIASGDKEKFEKIKQISVETLIKSFFDDVGGDYNNPDKGSLQMVVDKLAGFAKNFRDQKTIKNHYGEIIIILDKL